MSFSHLLHHCCPETETETEPENFPLLPKLLSLAIVIVGEMFGAAVEPQPKNQLALEKIVLVWNVMRRRKGNVIMN